ncbi:MAG TPA: hypothetical protein H9972_01815, partial [Candidatus Paraprevotella stercorigallinarum]|nr:hypothetical protein [Candidatus Paraprevotella stercorigallinarum]
FLKVNRVFGKISQSFEKMKNGFLTARMSVRNKPVEALFCLLVKLFLHRSFLSVVQPIVA